MIIDPHQPILQPIFIGGHAIDVLRLDLIHPEVNGNKFFKLKYNLEKAKAEGASTVLTFGGAVSNHIAATASACKIYGLRAVGIIRGQETMNTMLSKAVNDGMELHFVSREAYSKKNEPQFKKYLTDKFGALYLIPEGGNNKEGIEGCTKIMKPEWNHNLIFCACGTAATFCGIVASVSPRQKVIGMNVLKGNNELVKSSEQTLNELYSGKKISVSGNEALEKEEIEDNCILNHYSFTGYAKFSKELYDFKIAFETEHKIPLDHVYTVKLFYAVSDLIKKRKINPHAKIIVIHSGGLQGNQDFENRYQLRPSL